MGPETMVGHDKLLIRLAGVTPSTGTINVNPHCNDLSFFRFSQP